MPNFIAVISCLTEEYCKNFNNKIFNASGIQYRNVGSKLNHIINGKFPFSFSYLIVKHFDGPNSGLVLEESFALGENYTFLTTKDKRGILYGDMINLNQKILMDSMFEKFIFSL